MKTFLGILFLSGALLLFSSLECGAPPPRQHAVTGIITGIDYDAHIITLAPAKGDRLVFVWNDSTRFSQGSSRICLGALEPGQSAKIRYRREIGQLISREVRLRKETPTRCTTGDCCARQS